jgi:hypothetical protein
LNINEFYDGDPRRRSSSEIAYGSDWRDPSDASTRYALYWIEGTREIYLMRRPQPPLPPIPNMPGDAALPLVWVIDRAAVRVEVLGWADDRHALDQALAGWEDHMSDPNGVQWIRESLKNASQTDPGRGPR